MESGRTLRLFFALWPDDATRAALASLQRGLPGRVTAIENLHLTMAFLGAQPDATLPALSSLAAQLPPRDITLSIDRLGSFARSRVAWAGMSDVPQALRDWQAELISGLAAQGIVNDREFGFTPHVTLARNAAPVEARPREPMVWRQPRLVLVSSETRPEGARYALVASATGAAP